MQRTAFIILAAACIAGAAAAQSADGAYTPVQADRGDKLLGQHCAECHAGDLSGTPGAPALRGPGFAVNWNGKPVGDLYKYIHDSMPPGQPGSLTEPQYADLVAAILKANKQPSGTADLAGDGPGMKTVMAIP